MAADIITIADLVTAALNEQLPEWGYTANAEMLLAPTFTLETLDTVKFSVIPMTCPRTIYARGLLELRPTIAVEIRKRTGNDPAANEALMAISEQVAEWFLGGQAEGLDGCMEADTTPIFSTDKMIEQGVYACGAELTFQIVRPPK